MKAITKPEQQAVVKQEDAKRVLAILRTTMPSLSKVDDETALLAIAYARHLGLDPLKKEIHLIPYWDKEQKRYVIQTIVAYTEYLKRAEESGKLDGWEVSFGEDENLGRYATVTIYRKDRSHPVKWTVYEQEVKRDTTVWKQQPLFMLRKVAIAQAFRMAFPTETAMLPYEEAEMWEPPPEEPHLDRSESKFRKSQENVSEPKFPETQTTASEPMQHERLCRKSEPKTDEPQRGESAYITEAQRRRFFAIVKKELGYREDFIKDILKEKFGIEKTSEIPADRYEEIIDYFRMLSEPIEVEEE